MRTSRIMLSLLMLVGFGLIMAVTGSAQASPVTVSFVKKMPTDCTSVTFEPSDLQRKDGQAAQVVMHAACPQDVKLFTQLVHSKRQAPAKPYQLNGQWLVPLPMMRPGQFYRLRLIVKLDSWSHKSRVFNVSRVVPTKFAKGVNRPTAAGTTKQFFMDLSSNNDQITMVSRMRLKLTDGRLQRGSADLIGPTSRLVEFNPVERDAKVDIGSPASGGFVFTDATTKPKYSVYIDKEFSD